MKYGFVMQDFTFFCKCTVGRQKKKKQQSLLWVYLGWRHHKKHMNPTEFNQDSAAFDLQSFTQINSTVLIISHVLLMLQFCEKHHCNLKSDLNIKHTVYQTTWFPNNLAQNVCWRLLLMNSSEPCGSSQTASDVLLWGKMSWNSYIHCINYDVAALNRRKYI